MMMLNPALQSLYMENDDMNEEEHKIAKEVIKDLLDKVSLDLKAHVESKKILDEQIAMANQQYEENKQYMERLITALKSALEALNEL